MNEREVGRESAQRATGISGDPYLFLAQAASFTDYLDEAPFVGLRHAVMIELRAANSVTQLRSALGASGHLCATYGAWEASRFCTGWVDDRGLALLQSCSDLVSRFELASAVRAQRGHVGFRGVPISKSGAPSAFQNQSKAAPNSKVLLGLIDDGCPFAHADVLDGKGQTRIRAIWDQSLTPAFAGHGATPTQFCYGREVLQGALNALIASAKRGGEGELECYRQAGYSALEHSKSHGAHSLGLLATNRAAVRERPPCDVAINDADVAFVQLPRSVLHAPSHAALSRSILDGVRWIIDQATENERVVIAVPYSSAVGAHDGTSIFEKALSDIVSAACESCACAGVTVFLAAGNSYKQSLHAKLAVGSVGNEVSLTLRVPPSSEVPAFVEVWVPSALEAHASITSPDGEVSSEIRRGGALFSPASGGQPEYQLLHSEWQGDDATLLLFRLAPTLTSDGTTAARYGDWKINLRVDATSCAHTDVHAYAARARGSYLAPTRGGQSVFIADNSGKGWAVEPEGTVSGMACGSGAFVVSGFENWAPQEPAPYCSAPPGRAGGRCSVDYSAPCEEFPSLDGVSSLGTRSGSTVRLNGSSVAVPQLARAIALAPIPYNYKGPRLGTKI